MQNLTIGFAGLSHLGTCSSIAAHLQGNKIVAFDSDNKVINERMNGRFDSAEPGIDSFLSKIPFGYKLTNDVSDLKECDLVFISVDSLVSDDGELNTSNVEGYFDSVSTIISDDVPIVIMSQVSPGFTRIISKNRPQTYYQMETLVFGEGLHRATSPERYVVGVEETSNPINPLYQIFLKQGGCDILKMNFESAELTKLSANFILASTITATNTLASLSAKVDANWKLISHALKLDRRIGPHAYLDAGLGIGGSNIVRDLKGIEKLSSDLGLNTDLVQAILSNSEYSKNWMFHQLTEAIKQLKSPRIGILGLSYKRNTSSTVGSVGLKTAKVFSKNFSVTVYDPVVNSKDIDFPLNWSQSYEQVISNSNILIIATDWIQFRQVTMANEIQNSEVNYLIDPYGCQFENLAELPLINYKAIGIPKRTEIL
jgi:UDPglucose 6-dehydrogenase